MFKKDIAEKVLYLIIGALVSALCLNILYNKPKNIPMEFDESLVQKIVMCQSPLDITEQNRILGKTLEEVWEFRELDKDSGGDYYEERYTVIEFKYSITDNIVKFLVVLNDDVYGTNYYNILTLENGKVSSFSEFREVF